MIESNDSDPYAKDQIKYYLNGKLVSKEDFYQYGFQHEKVKKKRK